MKKEILFTFLIFFTTLLIYSCSKKSSDPESNPCDGVVKNWSTDVMPLIQTYCNQAACHDPGSNNGVGPLTNYTEVYDARTRIRDAVQTGTMPQNTVLTAEQKKTIICWIENGAPNN